MENKSNDYDRLLSILKMIYDEDNIGSIDYNKEINSITACIKGIDFRGYRNFKFQVTNNNSRLIFMHLFPDRLPSLIARYDYGVEDVFEKENVKAFINNYSRYIKEMGTGVFPIWLYGIKFDNEELPMWVTHIKIACDEHNMNRIRKKFTNCNCENCRNVRFKASLPDELVVFKVGSVQLVFCDDMARLSMIISMNTNVSVRDILFIDKRAEVDNALQLACSIGIDVDNMKGYTFTANEWIGKAADVFVEVTPKIEIKKGVRHK